jgi:hypothetical protein
MSFRKMRVGEFILGEIVETGKTYLVQPQDWFRGIDEVEHPAYKGPLRVPARLTAFLNRLGATNVGDGFLIIRETEDIYYLDAGQESPGNGKRYVLRGNEYQLDASEVH